MWPGVDALLVAPSNAHALFARPLVVAPESTVTVHIDPGGQIAVLACDGRRIREIPPGSRVHVSQGAATGDAGPAVRPDVHRSAGPQVQAAGARLARPAALTVARSRNACLRSRDAFLFATYGAPSRSTVSDIRTSVRSVLQELRISDLGVIDDAALEPHPGFTVVTGETGAGKTMIVTALGLVTGGRGDAARVRAGSDRAVVEARFAVPRRSARPPTRCTAAGGRPRRGRDACIARALRRRRRPVAGARRRPARLPLATLAEAHRAADRGARSVRGDLAAPAGPAARGARPVRRAAADAADRVPRAPRPMAAAAGRPRRPAGAAPGSARSGNSCSGSGWPRSPPSHRNPGEDVELIAEVRRLRERRRIAGRGRRRARAALSGSGDLTDAPTAVAPGRTAARAACRRGRRSATGRPRRRSCSRRR